MEQQTAVIKKKEEENYKVNITNLCEKYPPFSLPLKKCGYLPPPLKKQRKKEGKPSSMSRFQCLESVGDIDEL